ncbi:4Fe-4S dicluster domain-containing protein [Clostridium sp. HCP1S3_B4]|uniref:4Fe-4S dicluster domain-containing protein n=1 Tax=unclassified Clostridium TaxID=2614128 RepID=UPI001695E609|nr:4Fe-4S binding protein [Clostridiales bacterium]
MSIAINKDKCIGCKCCMEVCPGSLIKLDENNKAYIKYPKNCWGCCSCIKECKKNAIGLYLGADIGGMGSIMTVKKEKDILKWQIEKSNGEIHEIDVNTKDSNKY